MTYQNPIHQEEKLSGQENIIHPVHYNQYPKEVIDMMVDVFGTANVIQFCIINAFKCRMRLGHKGNIQEDIAKEKWYLGKAKDLLSLPKSKKVAPEPLPYQTIQ